MYACIYLPSVYNTLRDNITVTAQSELVRFVFTCIFPLGLFPSSSTTSCSLFWSRPHRISRAPAAWKTRAHSEAQNTD